MSKTKANIAGDAALLSAAADGDLTTVKARIAAGADVNAAGKGQIPALFQAVRSGKMKIVQALLDAGANLNLVAYPTSGSSVKSSPLCYAIEKKDQDIVEALLDAGADIGLATWSDHNAAASAAEQSCKAYYQLNASEEDWYGKKRTKADLAKAKADCEHWLHFVREAIRKGVKVRDYSLWEAVNHRHNELALLLISAGVNPSVAPHITSVLNRSIEHGNDPLTLALLKAGASVKRDGEASPLLVAAEKGRLSVVPALLEAGADINAVGNMQIGEFGPEEVEEETVAGGAAVVRTTHIPNPPVAEASTALIIATRLGNTAMVKLLVERGADLNLGDKHGVTALGWAMKLGKSEIAELLKKAGAAEPEDLEGSPNTALWSAAMKGDVAKAKALLKRGTKPDEPVEDREGKHFALVSAAREGHLEMVELLLQHGSQVNVGASENWNAGITPLMVAAREGHLNVVQALLTAGAALESKDSGYEDGGETAMHYAARGGHSEVIQALAKAGAKINAKAKGGSTPLLVAVSKKQHDAVKTLLSLKADPNAGPSGGAGPLFTAAQHPDFALVKLLLEHGARPNPSSKKPGFFPLGAAAGQNSAEIVRHLLTAGAEVNTQGVTGNTALSDATIYGHEGVVEILLAAKANPNLTDRDGFTPLMGAVISGKESVVSQLLAAGALVNTVAQDGRTAIKIARERKKPKILALLEAAAEKQPAVKPVKAKPARPADDDADMDDEGPDFSEAAASAAYQTALREVEKLSGAKAEPMNDRPGGFSFAVTREAAETLLDDHHQRLLKTGAYFFRSHRDHRDKQDQLGLLPTRDWADVLRTFQTNGANYDLGPGDIVKWLQKLALQQPFVITGASWDWLEGRFTDPVKNPRKLAKQMYEFCPDIVDQGIGSVKNLAQALEKDGYFFFWWD